MQHSWEKYPLWLYLKNLMLKIEKEFGLCHTDLLYDIKGDKRLGKIIIRNCNDYEKYFKDLPEVIDTNLINDDGELIA
jgi:hypothetical protein